MLPLSVLAPNGYEALASDLEAQKPAAFLPPGTDASIIKGYAAQQRTMAAAIRSNNTAFIQFPLSGAAGGALFNMHPLSRGSVTLNTSYPLSGPVVDYRALSNPLDMHINIVLLQGIRNYFALPALEALAPIEVAPGANVTSFDAMAEFISRTLGPSAYHNVGTCAKMPLEFGGVVDESLKVHGLRKLRVVDASVIPILVGGTTQSTVYALAEKVSDRS
jgi:choline dehydrogenase-like flavoprotein